MYERVDLWSVFRVLNSKLEYDCNRWQVDLLYIWLGVLLLFSYNFLKEESLFFLKYIMRPSAY